MNIEIPNFENSDLSALAAFIAFHFSSIYEILETHTKILNEHTRLHVDHSGEFALITEQFGNIDRQFVLVKQTLAEVIQETANVKDILIKERSKSVLLNKRIEQLEAK